jgi:hypothetical protein
MSELDTITDFANYLTRREKIIRSGRLLTVTGEEDLLGYYLASVGPDKEHDFVKPGGGDWADGDRLLISPGTFDDLAKHPGYQEKKKADEVSYKWDQLIELFANNILAGTSVSVFGEAPEASQAEQALRTMALEPRLFRRLLGAVLVEALEKAEKLAKDRYVRVLLPGPDSANRAIAYVFLILAYPKKIVLTDGYDQYRKVRMNILHAYCLRVLHENRTLQRALGVAFDASPKVTGRTGGSEDILALEVPEWTTVLEEQTRELTKKFDIMDPARVVLSVTGIDEYPTSNLVTVDQHEPRRSKKQRRKRQVILQDRNWREQLKRSD